MLERLATGESIRAYVDRTRAHLSPRERARLGDRIGRATHTALQTLRERAQRDERRAALAAA
jgi:hypothetical protein